MVTAAVRQEGYSWYPQFPDKALQMTVEALGWDHICDCNESALAALRAHFYRTYGAMQMRVMYDSELLAIEKTMSQKQLEH